MAGGVLASRLSVVMVPEIVPSKPPGSVTCRPSMVASKLPVMVKTSGLAVAVTVPPVELSVAPSGSAALSVRVTVVDSEPRSEEHTSELQSLMRISYAVFCLKKKHQNDQELRHTK